MTSYGVLGVGSIASAMVTGLCDGVAEPPEIVASPRNAARTAELVRRFPSVRSADDNQQVVDESDVVIVCLRPEDAPHVLAGLTFRADQPVVSAVAGLPVGQLIGLVEPATDIARSIPVPAVATRVGLTPVFPATRAAHDLFNRLGGSLPVPDEATFDSLSAASATVAAYFRYLGTIADWLVGRGMPAAGARDYVAQTFAGLSGELTSPDADFAGLARDHTTPGGLNEQFASALDTAGTFAAVRAGLDALLTRISPGSARRADPFR